MKATRPQGWTGERLRKLRKRLKMNQAEMAARLGYVRAGTISDFEHDRRTIPHRTGLLLDMLDKEADRLEAAAREET